MHREALDWGWRSYAVVADQIARGVDQLADPATPVAAGPIPVIAPRHPDAVAAALAVLASGSPLTLAEEGWWPPACRGALDRQPLESLAPRVDPAAATAPIVVADRTVHADRIVAAARDLIDHLPTAPVAPKRGARRPILVTGAGLPADRLLIVATASLLLDAVWALEPQADAFASAALWARPTLIVGCDDELRDMAARWQTSNRLWSRLRTVIRFTPDAVPIAVETSDPELDFDVPILRWHGAA